MADGRRPIYLFGLPLIVVGSIGIAYARTVSSVFIWRFIQAMGASPGFAVGGGVIGDIYPVEHRGTAMGIYFAACLLGSALAPFVSGVISNYTSWRFMQITLAGTGLLGFILISLFYPETMHPGSRGIEKWRQKNGHADDKLAFVWLNPLKVVSLLKNPNLLLVSIASFAIILCEYGQCFRNQI
jgi:MFS family permease